MIGNGKTRGEVLMAGIGGQGVLSSGQVLLEAAFHAHEFVSFIASYGFARRGGLCECTVIFGDEKIASPLLHQSDVVMLLDSDQFAGLEPRVRSGGIIIAEKAGFEAERQRDDYNLHIIPALDTAMSMGSAQGKNLILLGSYVAITKAVTPELVEEELRHRYAENEKVLQRNIEAFKRGLELAKSTN